MSSAQWFYSMLGTQHGPVSYENLKRLALSGQLPRDGLVWQEGWPDWRPASTVEGLFPVPPPLPGGHAAHAQETADQAHHIQNGVCKRCGCTESYITSMGKIICRGGASSSPAPVLPAQLASPEPTAESGPGVLFALGALGALFGVRQLLFVDSGQGIVILIISAVVMLIGRGAPARGNENRMR